MNKPIAAIFCLLISLSIKAESGYDLCLRYIPVSNTARLHQYKTLISAPGVIGNSPVVSTAKKMMFWFYFISWNELCYKYYTGAGAVKKMQPNAKPSNYEQPDKTLEYNKNHWFPLVPGKL